MADLKIFTDNIEEDAINQINNLLAQEAFRDSEVRIMPDVHVGKNMEGIYTSSVTTDTIDASPFAYKPMSEILEKIIPTVKVDKIVKPVYYFKASENRMYKLREEKESMNEIFHCFFLKLWTIFKYFDTIKIR